MPAKPDKKAARDKLTQVRARRSWPASSTSPRPPRRNRSAPCRPARAATSATSRASSSTPNRSPQPAFALKVGEVSDIVESPYGLHLIKVTDRKVGRISEFDKIRDEVREFYVEELRVGMLAGEREKAKIEINIP